MKASLSSLGTKGSEYDLIWVRGFQPGNRRTKREGRIFIHGSRESLMAPWKHFFAKAAKSFENQCETESVRSHQSLWKPFRFWFVSLNFGTEVLALQSVTSWCQNWSSGVPRRREAPAEKMSPFSYFSAKSEKSVTGVTWVWTSFLLKVGATGVPPPNESFFEQLGDQRFRI